MTNKQEYILSIADAISSVHHRPCKHLETVPVHEVSEGKTVWQGEVEVFMLDNDPSKKIYAWMYREGGQDRLAAVYGEPPVTSALEAVRIQIGKDAM